jgi:bisphosphoglycerate-dependent phosphoglycerate mutase
MQSLKITIDRVLPYWNNTIIPTIKSEKRVLVVAHGNSLRAIVKVLSNVSDAGNLPIMQTSLSSIFPQPFPSFTSSTQISTS